MLALIPPYPPEMEAALQVAAGAEGYAPEIHVEPDPGKAVCWRDLDASEDDRQLMADMEVQAVVREQGGRPERSRRINHWICFRDEELAQRLGGWAAEYMYQNTMLTAPEPDGAPLWRLGNRGISVAVAADHADY